MMIIKVNQVKIIATVYCSVTSFLLCPRVMHFTLYSKARTDNPPNMLGYKSRFKRNTINQYCNEYILLIYKRGSTIVLLLVGRTKVSSNGEPVAILSICS